jgi:hypothetical protein
LCNKLVKEEDMAILCDCNKWYHIRCAKVTKAQYDSMVNDDYIFSWMCRDCFNLRPRTRSGNSPELRASNTPPNSEEDPSERTTEDPKSSQLNKVIELLMSDIGDLKEQITQEKKENTRLSEIIVKKMEVIFQLEQTIYNLTKPEGVEITNKASPTPIKQQTLTYRDAVRSCKGTDRPKPDPPTSSNINNSLQSNPCSKGTTQQDHLKPQLLMIGDSTLRAAASIIKEKNHTHVATHIIPGGKIQDISRVLSKADTIPPQILINIGSNSLSSSRTPNHTMRPIWYTIEAGMKKFKNTQWFVNGILFRRDVRDKYVMETNEALKFMCQQLGATYIDTLAATHEDCYGMDGIHPNRRGAVRLAECIGAATGLMKMDISTSESSPSMDAMRLPYPTTEHRPDGHQPHPEDQQDLKNTSGTINETTIIQQVQKTISEPTTGDPQENSLHSPNTSKSPHETNATQ